MSRTPAAYQPETEKHGTPISEPSAEEEWIPILVPASRFADFFAHNMYLDAVTPPGKYRPPPPTRVASADSPMCPPLPPRAWLPKAKALPPPLTRDINMELEEVAEDIENFEVTGIRRYKGAGLTIVYKTSFEEGRKPLKDFIDGDYITHQEVCDLINQWNDNAKKIPNMYRRRCLMCCNRAHSGKTLCGPCMPTFEKVIYG